MNIDQQGRAYVRVGKPAVAVLTGEDDLSEWDDEELLRGRRRDAIRRFSGRPPRVVPSECLRELNRRNLFDTESVIREGVVTSAKYLLGVVKGTERPNSNRQKAAEVFLDRFLGKPTQQHQVQANVTVDQPLWLEILQRKVSAASEIAAAEQREAITAEDIVDAEVVEDRPTFDPPAAADDDYVFEDDDEDEDEWE